MTSALAYQALLLRLSPRFSIPTALAFLAWLVVPFPWLAARLVPRLSTAPWPLPAALWEGLSLGTVIGALVTLTLAGLGALFALWVGTAAYRLLPPRPVAWFRAGGVPATPAPGPGRGLGRYQRIGIILAGGGAKGAYQAGSLRALHHFLEERDALGSVEMLAASSIGAWNACFWLAGRVADGEPGTLAEWWHRLDLSEIVAPTYYVPAWRNYVLSADPWRSAFRRLFLEDPAARERLLHHLETPDAPGALHFYLTRTNVERAHLEFSTNRRDSEGIDNFTGRRGPLVPPDRWRPARTPQDLEEALFASMDIPPLFEYARIGDELFEDGGTIDNLPIAFGTGIEKCDLLFVLPLNASYAAAAEGRSILKRLQRVMTIRHGALERKSLKDVYLYNELAALREACGGERAPDGDGPVEAAEGHAEDARRTLAERAMRRVHRPVQIFAVAPDEPLALDTVEFWQTERAGRAFRLMEEHTAYELGKFDFDAPPNWIRVALIGPQGEVRYLEDF
ncbi:MAG TPA: patatin-like phospholipase family protein [Gemmatimonadota bacterium]|nr:patatin-like phospholipase family protein [Gemmatimonadota bacterium]